eukprot:TRINITY_DN1570_c0_g1_i1.p1 TRINITY_DN1570_c0_g1~~TRINITY_DN1570_c0_g1_i1.p1  ORF type:complete len:490 (-),score=73.02 TRINITY_DN1570_c0_g1_i1:82-1551(-)
MRRSKAIPNKRKYITWFAGLGVIVFFLFVVINREQPKEKKIAHASRVEEVKEKQQKVQTDSTNNEVEETRTSRKTQSFTPSKFHNPLKVTTTTDSYDVVKQPSCFIDGCVNQGNWYALTPCSNDLATEWNKLGVDAVERFMEGPFTGLGGYNQNSLLDAYWFFSNATAEDSTCVNAHLNRALVLTKMKKFDEALESIEKVISNADENPRIHLYRGFVLEQSGNKNEAMQSWRKGLAINGDLVTEYFGLLNIGTSANSLREYEGAIEREAVMDYLLWKEFSTKTFSNYGLLTPTTTNFFVQNKWIVLRKIVPPFALAAAQKCYHQLITRKVLTLGDPQAKRYTAYNSRCGAFLHFTFTDLVRKVVAHNAKPSYTYFGGYVEGSTLQPHTDRFQCEFTFSLTVENHPWNETWLLSLGHVAVFEKNDERNGKNPEEMPPEDEIEDADLYAGDALLFMGRHLIHFRRGALGAGKWINQIFLHYVREEFSKSLG